MITRAEDYMQLLYLIQDTNFPTQAILLPTDEKIYNIDLNKRTIEAPSILSAERDHQAETVYFKCARYFDNMDLTNTMCVVQYINHSAKNSEGLPDGGHVYPVPFYDTTTCVDEYGNEEILFPWVVEGPATQAAGTVEFAVRFYLLNDNGTEYLYNLNTQTAKSKVLHGMNVFEENNENLIILDSDYEKLFQRINEVAAMQNLTWIIEE